MPRVNDGERSFEGLAHGPLPGVQDLGARSRFERIHDGVPGVAPVQRRSDRWIRGSPFYGAPLDPRVGGCRQEQLHGGVGEDHRADVSTLDHGVGRPERPLRLAHELPDLWMSRDLRDVLFDPAALQGRRRRGTLDLELGRRARSQAEPQPSRELRERVAVVRIDPRLERGERQRSVHHARVHVRDAERPRDPASERALARARGAVDRDHPKLRHDADPISAPSPRTTERNPGNETSAASMPDTSHGASARRAATANAMARR